MPASRRVGQTSGAGRALAAPQVTALDAVPPHQPLDALAVDGVPEAPPLGMDAPDPVGALVRGVNLADLRDQGVLGGLPHGAGPHAGEPLVVARTRDLKDPTYPLNTEVGAILGDEVPAVVLHFTSRAKYAAARSRISRSNSHSFSALRSRPISARSRVSSSPRLAPV